MESIFENIQIPLEIAERHYELDGVDRNRSLVNHSQSRYPQFIRQCECSTTFFICVFIKYNFQVNTEVAQQVK